MARDADQHDRLCLAEPSFQGRSSDSSPSGSFAPDKVSALRLELFRKRESVPRKKSHLPRQARAEEALQRPKPFPEQLPLDKPMIAIPNHGTLPRICSASPRTLFEQTRTITLRNSIDFSPSQCTSIAKEILVWPA